MVYLYGEGLLVYRAVPNMGFSVFGRMPNSSLQYSAEYAYEYE